MVRMRVPAGILTPKQWLGVEKIALERANGTIRLTTRETIQFHGVLKGNLQPLMQGLHAAVARHHRRLRRRQPQRHRHDRSVAPRFSAELRTLARDMSHHLLPRTRAWHEIWLDEEKVAGGEEEDEPILGRTYLPRKFKIGIALPPNNDVDVFAQDLGFIAIVENDRYRRLQRHGRRRHGDDARRARDLSPRRRTSSASARRIRRSTWRRRSSPSSATTAIVPIASMPASNTPSTRWGCDRFVELVNERLTVQLAPARDFTFSATGDRLGWAEDGDGTAHFTLFVENGRITGDMLTALHAIADVGRRPVRHDAEPEPDPGRYSAVASPACGGDPGASIGLDRPVGGLRRNSMACVALPTCGLALAESERYLPDLITRLEDELDRLGCARTRSPSA